MWWSSSSQREATRHDRPVLKVRGMVGVVGLIYAVLYFYNIVVANHHPEKIKLLPKFFSALVFYPAGPIWAIYFYE
jgi:hypothetical protein